MIQTSFLTSDFLFGLHFSKAQREMWLKLEFGEAEKQENRGRGERKRGTSSSQFTQAKCLLAHLHLPHLSFEYNQDDTQAHKKIEAGDIPQHIQGEITACQSQ